jgi:hypothetical protein
MVADAPPEVMVTTCPEPAIENCEVVGLEVTTDCSVNSAEEQVPLEPWAKSKSAPTRELMPENPEEKVRVIVLVEATPVGVTKRIVWSLAVLAFSLERVSDAVVILEAKTIAGLTKTRSIAAITIDPAHLYRNDWLNFFINLSMTFNL